MVHKMPDEDAGKLFKLIFEYTNDEEPDESKYGILVEVAFAQIKQILKRDLVKWEDSKEGKRIGGRMGNLKRYQNDLYLQVVDKKLTLEQAEELALSRKTSHSDTYLSHSDVKESLPMASVAVNVNDNVNGSIIKGLCDVFGITEMNNPKSYFAATHFIENLSRTHRLEYFQKQIHAYPLVLKKEFRHKFQNFIGDPKQNYENGEWCAKTYEVTQEQKPKKQDGDALLNSLRTD